MTSETTTYLFDTADPDERVRLRAQAELWDDVTFRNLAEIGVGPGWQCLEIGAGAGSVARWLLERVGPAGHVVATDTETRWLEPMAAANFEVRHHDVVDDALEVEGYDLVHARLVLEHLPQRDAIARKMVEALRPGGWVVLEDYDVRAMALTEPEVPGWADVNAAIVEAMREAGSDPTTGAALGSLLARAGLDQVRADGVVRSMPIPALAAAFRPPLVALHDRLLERGVTAEEQRRAVAAFDAGVGASFAYTPILVCARGVKAPSR